MHLPAAPTGFGSDRPPAARSTKQTFSFWELSEPKGLREVKKDAGCRARRRARRHGFDVVGIEIHPLRKKPFGHGDRTCDRSGVKGGVPELVLGPNERGIYSTIAFALARSLLLTAAKISCAPAEAAPSHSAVIAKMSFHNFIFCSRANLDSHSPTALLRAQCRHRVDAGRPARRQVSCQQADHR
jgi:hypothetical protein